MDTLEDRFRSLRTWSRRGQRAPHKPLLLLWALARVQRREARLAPWTELAPALTTLLEDYGPPRKAQHPEHPFWRLQADGLWEVTGPTGSRLTTLQVNRSGDVAKSALADAGAMGGFPAPIYEALAADAALVNRSAAAILAAHFPDSLHEDILDAVDLPFVAEPRPSRRRDPAFRATVLDGYDHCCAICALSLSLGGRAWGVEAAHVRWHAHGGPDAFDNGLALCVLHHKALDRGAIGIDEHRCVLVSRRVSASPAANVWLIQHHGQPLRSPQSGLRPVHLDHAAWHRREVFQAPAR